MGVENLVAKTTFTESQLKQFLDTPPLCENKFTLLMYCIFVSKDLNICV